MFEGNTIQTIDYAKPIREREEQWNAAMAAIGDAVTAAIMARGIGGQTPGRLA